MMSDPVMQMQAASTSVAVRKPKEKCCLMARKGNKLSGYLSISANILMCLRRQQNSHVLFR